MTIAGCAGLPTPVETPSVDVEAVQITSVGFTGIEGVVDLDVFNPNGFGVPLESGEWMLAIGGSRAVTGRFDLVETIPARRAAPVTASMMIKAADAAIVGAELASGERDYTIRGRLRFSTSLGAVEVEFEKTGTIAGTGAVARRLF